MRKRAGSLGFAIVTVLLTLVTAFCFAGTAMGRMASGRAEQEERYRRQEEQVVSRVRVFLEEQGFANSGVMLTRVVEPDGRREYTLTVHHGGIGRLTGSERDALTEGLANLSFEDEADAVTFFGVIIQPSAK